MKSKNTKGVGDYLHAKIKRLTRQDFTDDCGCEAFAAKMNRWGPDGCRQRMPRIVRRLRAQANQRKWWKYLTKIYGAKKTLTWLVASAIAAAERDQQLHGGSSNGDG